MPLKFLHIPKTGGSSIRQALTNAQWPDLEMLRHHKVPEKNEGDFVFTFVREPFSRAMSLYNGFRPSSARPPFMGFLKRLERGTWPDQYRCQPQTFWVNACTPDFVGRFESLQLDFDTLCEIRDKPHLSLPKINRSQKAFPASKLTEQHKDVIRTLYKEDFEAFGYSME